MSVVIDLVMGALGLRTVDEMVGRADLLALRDGIDHWKASTLDLGAVFHQPRTPNGTAIRCVEAQDHGLDDPLNARLVADAAPAVERGAKVVHSYEVRNVNRAVGTTLSYHVARRYGLAGLPDDTITCRFRGSAGQSFGAFASRGMTLVLEGEANDYLGKGLSGGKLIVRVPEGSMFEPAENVIAGNTVLYGATGGEAYINGLAGERFCVRNSGARVVVEGVGDHGCEYMTGGLVAVLGLTGVNFAAGMSGGIAYVYDPRQDFDLRCNLDMVDLEPLTDPADAATLKALVEAHARYTHSTRAAWMLDRWEETRILFVKVMPIEYRRALGQMAEADLHARRTREETVSQA